MTTPFLELLTEIASGTTMFEPVSRTSRDIVEFQNTVARLREMEHLNFIRGVWKQVREIAGQEYYEKEMALDNIGTRASDNARRNARHKFGGAWRRRYFLVLQSGAPPHILL